ncbi:hypothetical protein BDD43_2227 [Mucilaginibacter gracilis]|uniref:Uncharacterized protein n=1 Tax=Mucilaginibacter gracilis TaxID=423350 RepID=A0A495IZA7_9SPHI|nr:hypothetical protein [Mucilaginibacter gracilis]RKR82060.1 hypothetical protein BDD43_2227 [Mucilaginibacter gracilis]
MKAITVTKSKVTVEMTIDSLYTIFNSLNVVEEQYDLLGSKAVNRAVEEISNVLEEVTDLLAGITDDKGNPIPTL